MFFAWPTVHTTDSIVIDDFGPKNSSPAESLTVCVHNYIGLQSKLWHFNILILVLCFSSPFKIEYTICMKNGCKIVSSKDQSSYNTASMMFFIQIMYSIFDTDWKPGKEIRISKYPNSNYRPIWLWRQSRILSLYCRVFSELRRKFWDFASRIWIYCPFTVWKWKLPV